MMTSVISGANTLFFLMVSAHVLANSCVFCDKNYYLKEEKNNS